MKPFLKWPGGKFKLVPRIAAQLDDNASRLVEPFLGSGAVFLNTDYKRYLLADSNEPLITLYQTVQTQKDKFIRAAAEYFTPAMNTVDKYQELRDQFNKSEDAMERSLLFLYLNRHGYNGLCRFNKKGGFNVPFGRNPKPYFPEEELRYFITKSKRAEFVLGDFRIALREVKKGDTVYADPPYVPLTATANFTAYDGNVFTQKDQMDLIKIARQSARNGITTVISNHNTEQTLKAYQEAGATISKFEVRRFISCQGENRENAPELLAIFAH